MKSLFALVDCNAFYVSCERVFQPRLEGVPVIVLSSNDGCAIARSPEAKALGIKMGDPLFKIRDIVKAHNVRVFSANFSLYGDMSNRVMDVLRTFSPLLEVYSIDEAFLNLRGFPPDDMFAYGCRIKEIVRQWTGIPVSVGIGPTKTLAKVANHLAKKHPKGCQVLLTPEEWEPVLKDFPLPNVWGVGSQWSKKLASFQKTTALDLARADPRWVRKTFNVVLARTALELGGVSCLSLEEVAPAKKSMISSRSFGVPVTSFEGLREAISSHASALARRLREQRSKTSLLSVSIRTNPFDQKGQKYARTKQVPLATPTQDTSLLIKAAAGALETIFREGLSYKKAGVMALAITPEDQEIPSLFEESEEPALRQRRAALLKAMDRVNVHHGRGTLVFASEGFHKPWRPKSTWKSPSYTQDWACLPEVR